MDTTGNWLCAPPGLPGTGSFVYDDATASTTHYIFFDDATVTDGDVVLSVYVKDAGDARWISLRTNNAGSTRYVIFSPVTGVASEVGADVEDYGSVAVGNGWYRCWIQVNYTANEIGMIIGLSNSATPGDDLPFYSGDAASGVYLYGAQMENRDGAWDSENLLLQSNQFDTTWANGNSTETGGLYDPDGGTNAWSLNEDGTAGVVHYLLQTFTFSNPCFTR